MIALRGLRQLAVGGRFDFETSVARLMTGARIVMADVRGDIDGAATIDRRLHMDALAETCRARGAELDPNTLKSLLYREKLRYMGNYEFRVDQNHIDVDNFRSLCYEILSVNMQQTQDFYDEAVDVLQSILRSIFETINSRVASLDDRLENQEVWEAMFEQFALHRQ